VTSVSRYAVVLVEPETPGNVGTVARAMKNFGFSDLRLVDPPPLEPGGEAYGFAGHAREDVLPDATRTTLDAVVSEFHTVGFTAITGEDARRHVRFPVATPGELAAELAGVDLPVAFVFGREGRGLNNDELARLDEVCTIPASPDYPVLNLGQAATVALYELRTLTLGGGDEGRETGEDGGDGPAAGAAGDHLPDVDGARAAPADVERLHEFFGAFLDAAEHREHKRAKARRLFRRLLGRARPTDREVATLTGVLRKAAARLNGELRSADGAVDPGGGEDGEDGGDGGDATADTDR
jgi:TrmH family RNA methyltransferase